MMLRWDTSIRPNCPTVIPRVDEMTISRDFGNKYKAVFDAIGIVFYFNLHS
jgi:hypothetical protein